MSESVKLASVNVKIEVDDYPLFVDIFRRPGAIYWFGKLIVDSMEGGFLL